MESWGRFGGHSEVGHGGAGRPPLPFSLHHTMHASAALHLCPNVKHRNTGCTIKSAPVRAHCEQWVDRERYQERHWHRKVFPHWRKTFYFSHRDSLWVWWIILSFCLNAVNYYPIICFSVDFQDLHVLVLMLNRKGEMGQHMGDAYIRDRTLTMLVLFYRIDPTRKATHTGT